ncbi:MAG: bifunctional proline dehydrogenase/L-glutamate gamma-semialdehyde dehydrogenase PutA [Gammaproteobacteria bacterium]|nr:bifunctional proline dehydrogenase/L-glutamate gamma-semialdehyde dehydrogenase PutA [Gammaproteobacteria bacterium]
MLAPHVIPSPKGLRAKINAAYRPNEFDIVSTRIKQATLPDISNDRIQKRAIDLVERVRSRRKSAAGIDAFLTEYALSSDEGIALMCLAESLLRIPDTQTIDELIKDKLAKGNWSSHKNQSDSFFINATTWALMLTGKFLDQDQVESKMGNALIKTFNRGGEHIIRAAVDQAMRIMGKQFVMGRTIQEALKRAKKQEAQGYRYSYDMLGEAALTTDDAERYFGSYLDAIHAIGKSANPELLPHQNPGISIKLSALHPRYSESQHEYVLKTLPPKLLELAQAAKSYQLGMTIDAEESERLDLSLDVMEAVIKSPSLSGWDGFGLAVQSYQKRAYEVIEWVGEIARTYQRRLMVRLIKGAYWDSEIKKAQMQGLSDYPVFTRKTFTDVSFQACIKKLLTMTDVIYPQFATHNAHTVATTLEMAGTYQDFEFQCLHGMGNELYEEIVPKNKLNIPCRIYAPVGSHEDLLPYLVRRLLENGANSSFVNRIVDEKAPIATLVEDPVAMATLFLVKINQNIPLPTAIFWPDRQNSIGIDLSDRAVLSQLQTTLMQFDIGSYHASPSYLTESHSTSAAIPVLSPQTHEKIGLVSQASIEDVENAVQLAHTAFHDWSSQPISHRTQCLEKVATLYEQHFAELLLLLNQEAGKTFPDAIAEVREAIDFCRYYATKATRLFNKPIHLEGYTGERNELTLHPRGPMLCISPWNFPLAIFTGQIVAALVTGNTVIAKPAEQTPLIADFAVKLMHEAGIPPHVVQCLPGEGETIGAHLTKDTRIKGVIFTGSTQTANLIQYTLATRGGDIVPFIAETGGMNAMIVDSSALLEQVVSDVIQSAFGSAGQRCSALRVLYLQEDIFDRFIRLLKGAMQALVIGDPAYLTTDIGPVIDKAALDKLTQHVETMIKTHSLIEQVSLPKETTQGYFMPPTVIHIQTIQDIPEEIFGPVLHVISYKQSELQQVIEQINSTGYGLTLGIHSRIDSTIEAIRKQTHVGNCYVNRNMIGAVVGLQPFGGEGLSGTGPKAGGPFYLQRLCVERTFTMDTTASGGNASLMSLMD